MAKNEETKTICRGCGKWQHEHASGPPCSPFPPGFGPTRPPQWPLAHAWKAMAERADAAMAALERHGRHDVECIFDSPGGKCVCGLDAAKGEASK